MFLPAGLKIVHKFLCSFCGKPYKSLRWLRKHEDKTHHDILGSPPFVSYLKLPIKL